MNQTFASLKYKIKSGTKQNHKTVIHLECYIYNKDLYDKKDKCRAIAHTAYLVIGKTVLKSNCAEVVRCVIQVLQQFPLTFLQIFTNSWTRFDKSTYLTYPLKSVSFNRRRKDAQHKNTVLTFSLIHLFK